MMILFEEVIPLHTIAKQKKDLSTTAFLFLFFSLIGWVYEVILGFYYGFGFINRGFLFGPYLPIYGFGGLILLVCLGRFMEKKRTIGSLPATPLYVFLLILFITTALEYASSCAMEALFHQRWWDYSGFALNFQGRICLSASLRFGLGGMVFLYLVTPLFKKAAGRIPPTVRQFSSVILVGIVLADFIITMVIMHL